MMMLYTLLVYVHKIQNYTRVISDADGRVLYSLSSDSPLHSGHDACLLAFSFLALVHISRAISSMDFDFAIDSGSEREVTYFVHASFPVDDY